MSDPRLVRPVTVERLRTAVARRGELVREVPTGVVGQHDGRAYEVVLDGVGGVRVRSRWSRMLPRGTRAAAIQLVNDWNRDRILPTLHTESAPDGVSIVASLTVSAGAGMSHEQLADVIEVTVTVSAHAMRALGASIPTAPTASTASTDPTAPTAPTGQEARAVGPADEVPDEQDEPGEVPGEPDDPQRPDDEAHPRE